MNFHRNLEEGAWETKNSKGGRIIVTKHGDLIETRKLIRLVVGCTRETSILRNIMLHFSYHYRSVQRDCCVVERVEDSFRGRNGVVKGENGFENGENGLEAPEKVMVDAENGVVGDDYDDFFGGEEPVGVDFHAVLDGNRPVLDEKLPELVGKRSLSRRKGDGGHQKSDGSRRERRGGRQKGRRGDQKASHWRAFPRLFGRLRDDFCHFWDCFSLQYCLKPH